MEPPFTMNLWTATFIFAGFSFFYFSFNRVYAFLIHFRECLQVLHQGVKETIEISQQNAKLQEEEKEYAFSQIIDEEWNRRKKKKRCKDSAARQRRLQHERRLSSPVFKRITNPRTIPEPGPALEGQLSFVVPLTD